MIPLIINFDPAKKLILEKKMQVTSPNFNFLNLSVKKIYI